MNLNAHQAKIFTEDFLLSITQNAGTLIQQPQTKAQETL